MKLLERAKYLRNFIFGVEDSLVSTVGLLSGVAAVGTEAKTIILAGVVLIFVEAFSMGVGSLLSENTAAEYLKGDHLPFRRSILPSIVMFLSYFLAGFIPLAPYLFLAPSTAFPTSIGASLVALFVLGLVGARLSRVTALRQGIEMLLIGGAAILLGVVVGIFVNSL